VARGGEERRACGGNQEDRAADSLNIGRAFLEMTARLMANPARLMQAQLGFWQDYVTLWQNTTRRIMGIEADPVIGPASNDKRFKDDASEVRTGFECGAGIANFNDVKVGDILECFSVQKMSAAEAAGQTVGAAGRK